MAYTIKNADGTVLLTLVDGTIDSKTTSLTLIGKNTDAYGTALNTNLVNMLQNFASISQPRSPLVGQLWYSKADGRLKVYTLNGIFEEIAAAIISSKTPTVLKQGDLWIDSTNNQLFFTKDGVNSTLAGPIYSTVYGKSGWIIETLKDVLLKDNVVTSLYSNNVLLGILSTSSFTLATTSTQNTQGMTNVNIGLTLNNAISGIRLVGTATNATAIAGIDPSLYLLNTSPADQNLLGGGGLNILSDNGITLGQYSDLSFLSSGFIGGRTSVVRNNIVDGEIQFVTIKSYPTGPDGAVIGMSMRGDRVGVLTSSPASDFHVVGNSLFTGDLTVTKNLTVSGTFTTVLSVVTRIEDKNIELAYNNTTDAFADGGGITLKGTTDKTLSYDNTLKSWSSNIGINVDSTSSYKIGGVNALTSSTLGTNILQSSLTRVGVLSELTVTNVVIKGNGITTTPSVYRIASLTSSGTSTRSLITVTLTTPVPILNTGSYVTIDGIVDTTYNNTYQISTVTSLSQFIVLSINTASTASPVLGATPTATFNDTMISASSYGDIDATGKRIRNLQYSTVKTDAATVQYVLDAQAINVLKGFIITLDITKMVDPNTDIATLLNVLAPPVNTPLPAYPTEAQYDLPVGYRARVLCQSHSITVPATPLNVVTTASIVMQYPSGNPVGAISNIAVTSAQVVTTATITYSVKEFRVQSGTPNFWQHYRNI
jgi:hypothetical protein